MLIYSIDCRRDHVEFYRIGDARNMGRKLGRCEDVARPFTVKMMAMVDSSTLEKDFESK